MYSLPKVMKREVMKIMLGWNYRMVKQCRVCTIVFNCAYVYSTFKHSFGWNYFCHLIFEYISAEWIYRGKIRDAWGAALICIPLESTWIESIFFRVVSLNYKLLLFCYRFTFSNIFTCNVELILSISRSPEYKGVR